MFSGVKSDGPFGGGPAEDIFKNLLAEEYGKTLARSGGIGIADSVYRQILSVQEVA
jgi:Rod binding domain-containing protein